MIRAVSILAVLALTSCALAGPPKVAVCDGKHRRPANPYGSVLPDAPIEGPKPGTVSAPLTAQLPTETVKPALDPVSLIDPRSTQPCGRSA